MFYGTLHKDLSPRSHGLVIRDLEVLPDCSGTKSMSQVGGLLDVPGEDGGGEAVVALVGSDGHLLQSFHFWFYHLICASAAASKF